MSLHALHKISRGVSAQFWLTVQVHPSFNTEKSTEPCWNERQLAVGKGHLGGGIKCHHVTERVHVSHRVWLVAQHWA